MSRVLRRHFSVWVVSEFVPKRCSKKQLSESCVLVVVDEMGGSTEVVVLLVSIITVSST